MRSFEPHRQTEATEDAEHAAGGTRLRSYASFTLRVAVGLAILAFFIWYYNLGAAFALLRRESPWFFAAATLLYLAGQVLSAYRWKLLAAMVNLRVPFARFVAYQFIGMFTNLFVPGLVGGDAARAVYLGRSRRRFPEALASVLADRATGLLAMFWLVAVAALAVGRSVLPPSVTNPVVAVGVAAAVAFGGSRFVAPLARFLPGRLGRSVAVVMPYLSRPLSLSPAFALSVVLQISLAVGQYLVALGLGLKFPLSLFLICVPIANALASIPVTLNGLGVREAAYLTLFGVAGIGKTDAVALGLLWFACTALAAMTGAAAFIVTELPAAPSPRRASAPP